MSEELKNEKVVIEEDWSDIMKFNPTGTAFSQHASIKIPLSSTVVMDIACIEYLTPLDMMNLSNGTSDSTGNRVWMGAFAFMEFFVKPLSIFHDNESAVSTVARQLKMLRHKLFHGANIIELGSGTGISGISLMMAHKCDVHKLSYIPSRVTFTDNDCNVLDLCKRNCDFNLGRSNDSNLYSISHLEWGEHLEFQESFNTVIATDVIYSLVALEPLIQTAHGLLLPGGHFVLSHIPRASISSKQEQSVALENEILKVANKYKLEPIFGREGSEYEHLCRKNYALRPDILEYIIQHDNLLGMYDWRGMHSVGAAVFIFKKCN